MRMDLPRRLAASYGAVQITFFGAMAPLSGFMSAYLLFRGFSNTQIGLIAGAASAVATVMQMAIGSMVDRSQRKPTSYITWIILIQMTLLLTLLVWPGGLFGVAVLYAALMVGSVSMTPLVNGISFQFQHIGVTLHFGIARAMGSVAFAVTMLIAGWVVTATSELVLPWFILAMYAGMIGAVLSLRIPHPVGESPVVAPLPPRPTGRFLARYPGYLTYLAGVVMVQFCGSVVITFLLQIILSKGGTLEQFSMALPIAAVCEVPMLVGFAWLSRRYAVKNLLFLSTWVIAFRGLAIFLAPSIPVLYVVQISHMFGYALFMPAGIYFVQNLMGDGDKMKGQAFLTSSMTMGGIVASLVGGRVLDLYNANILLILATCIAIVGNLVAMWGMQKLSKTV